MFSSIILDQYEAVLKAPDEKKNNFKIRNYERDQEHKRV